MKDLAPRAGAGGLTEVEQALVSAVAAGVKLDLGDRTRSDQKVAEEEMRSWGPDRTISATVIRDIVRGKRVPHPDPHGIRLYGARIDGVLDLEHVTSTVPLELHACFLTAGLVARGATLPTVTLERCWLEHPNRPPLAADQLTTNVLTLSQSTVIAHAEDRGVSLEALTLAGSLLTA